MTNATNNNPLVLVQPQLPVPRVPPNPNPPATEVAAVAGAELAGPLTLLEEVIAEAEAAVRELEASRPGSTGFADGATWREAVDADAAAAANGDRPKTWRTQGLLAGEHHRWAHARALAGAVPVLVQQTAEALDRTRIATVARERADTATTSWANAARTGWESRTDKAGAWVRVRAGEVALGEYLAARAVLEWATGTSPGRPDTEVRIPYTDNLPVDPTGRGHWLALGLFLNPDETWLSFPRDVEWPEDVGQLVTNAFPESGDRYVALAQRGVYERVR
jgi:hypothetical protein